MVEAALSEQRGRPKLMFIWLVLIVLLAVIGYLKFSDWKKAREVSAVSMAADERSLLPLKLEAISAVEVAYEGNLYRFERDEAGTWFYHAHGVNTGIQAQHGHVADPEQAAEIANRLAGLGRAHKERQVDSESKEQYGVTKPQMLILVYVAGSTKPLAQYAVGDVAPDKLSRYVLLVDSSEVFTIADFQIQNLLDLIKSVTSTSANTLQPQS